MKRLSVAAPVLATIAALAEFAACIFMAKGGSSGQLLTLVTAEMILIAAAIAQWVMYFRRYIDQKIEERLPGGQTERSRI